MFDSSKAKEFGGHQTYGFRCCSRGSVQEWGDTDGALEETRPPPRNADRVAVHEITGEPGCEPSLKKPASEATDIMLVRSSVRTVSTGANGNFKRLLGPG